MTPDTRVAQVVTALEAVGLSCLVMGGHAVRFYGLSRYTNDMDLHVAPDSWDDLSNRLARASLFPGHPILEGPTCRAHVFRRFCIGTLPDGRYKWLEFWKENHLLPPHARLLARAECGPYGGREIAFVGLEDLIRSKETERDADWQDVAVLEQFLDARLLARVRAGTLPAADALASLRSQTGFLGYLEAAHLMPAHAAAALAQATHPVTQSFLIPFAPHAPAAAPTPPLEPVLLARLRTTPPASPLHLALVEVVRRRTVAFRKDLDRRDKQAALAGGT